MSRLSFQVLITREQAPPKPLSPVLAHLSQCCLHELSKAISDHQAYFPLSLQGRTLVCRCIKMYKRLYYCTDELIESIEIRLQQVTIALKEVMQLRRICKQFQPSGIDFQHVLTKFYNEKVETKLLCKSCSISGRPNSPTSWPGNSRVGRNSSYDLLKASPRLNTALKAASGARGGNIYFIPGRPSAVAPWAVLACLVLTSQQMLSVLRRLDTQGQQRSTACRSGFQLAWANSEETR